MIPSRLASLRSSTSLCRGLGAGGIERAGKAHGNRDCRVACWRWTGRTWSWKWRRHCHCSFSQCPHEAAEQLAWRRQGPACGNSQPAPLESVEKARQVFDSNAGEVRVGSTNGVDRDRGPVDVPVKSQDRATGIHQWLDLIGQWPELRELARLQVPKADIEPGLPVERSPEIAGAHVHRGGDERAHARNVCYRPFENAGPAGDEQHVAHPTGDCGRHSLVHAAQGPPVKGHERQTPDRRPRRSALRRLVWVPQDAHLRNRGRNRASRHRPLVFALDGKSLCFSRSVELSKVALIVLTERLQHLAQASESYRPGSVAPRQILACISAAPRVRRPSRNPMRRQG